MPPHGTRPTSERVREALFSSLESMVELEDARVLDLFAGSGALGLEALSRGAGHVRFVESDRRAAGLIRRNARTLGFRGVRIEQTTVETALAAIPDGPYQVVFADPPYAFDAQRVERMLTALAGDWTNEDTVLVLERATRDPAPNWPEQWVVTRVREYGGTALHWAQRRLP